MRNALAGIRLAAPEARRVRDRIVRDKRGMIAEVVEEPLEGQ
jgi:hypothetical protein